MNQTVVINVVGLSDSILRKMPKLKLYSQKKKVMKINPVFPALTCSAQATYLTGELPSVHGIVGNGWYFKDLSQVWLWRQSNHLIQSEKLWEKAKKINPHFTCANLFWWFNMYSSVDYSITPRPLYRSDGQKLPDVYSSPSNLRETIQEDLGPFPLFKFWGPGANIQSTQWISESSKKVFLEKKPALTLVYLPHLDYCLQKYGPFDPRADIEMAQLDDLCERLIEFYEAHQAKILILSEYGIQEVHTPIPINQFLRKRGWLAIREECGEDHFDPGASQAFAVADHQICHIYIQNPELHQRIQQDVSQLHGVEKVLDREAQIKYGIAHDRSGDLVGIAEPGFWFSYKFWLDDDLAPDFARTVDIHKKPGYDPVELFLDPQIKFPKLYIAQKLFWKKLGFRTLLDVIPLDDSLVKGSHGRSEVSASDQPLCISEIEPSTLKNKDLIQSTQIRDLILDHIFYE